MSNYSYHQQFMQAMNKLAGNVPKRIQLTSRFMPNPPNSKRVMRPSRFGNPFPVEEKTPAGHQAVVDQYRAWLMNQPELIVTIKQELRGYDLVCNCPLGRPCHADVLLEVANQ